ncbi:hypothetical protein BC567DRAFT_49858 [Phyllosticta citribraziliensis]
MPGLSPTGFGNTTTAAFSSFSRTPGAQVSTNRHHNLYGFVSSIGPGKAKKRKTLLGVLGQDGLCTLRLSLIKILSLGSTPNYWCVLFEQSPVVCGGSKSLCGRENQHVHHLEKSPAGCYNNKKDVHTVPASMKQFWLFFRPLFWFSLFHSCFGSIHAACVV